MLYPLFQFFDELDIPGTGVFRYISFRSSMALILSLFISTIIGRRIISRLQCMQIGEIVRNLGLEGQMSKKGTPTMGGIIIIISILIPCLLVGRLDNIYMILMLVTTVWMGAIGFLDDYMKLKHHNKEGLHGRFKIFGQVGLGLIVGLTLYLSPDTVVRENVTVQKDDTAEIQYLPENIKSTQTTIPFVKNNNFDYADLVPFLGEHAQTAGWIIFILVTIFVVTAVSNGANLGSMALQRVRRPLSGWHWLLWPICRGISLMLHTSISCIYPGAKNLLSFRVHLSVRRSDFFGIMLSQPRCLWAIPVALLSVVSSGCLPC